MKDDISQAYQSINQSVNQSYLFTWFYQNLFSECGSNNWGPSCTQTCLCDMAKTSDCNNVDGNCTCKTGWQGATCVEDVNECTDNPTICNAVPNSQCSNMNGSYKCNCVTGYEKLTNGNCRGRLLLHYPKSDLLIQVWLHILWQVVVWFYHPFKLIFHMINLAKILSYSNRWFYFFAPIHIWYIYFWLVALLALLYIHVGCVSLSHQKVIYSCWSHNIAEILLKLTLNTNQSIIFFFTNTCESLTQWSLAHMKSSEWLYRIIVFWWGQYNFWWTLKTIFTESL